jgi:hypothetical protein
MDGEIVGLAGFVVVVAVLELVVVEGWAETRVVVFVVIWVELLVVVATKTLPADGFFRSSTTGLGFPSVLLETVELHGEERRDPKNDGGVLLVVAVPDPGARILCCRGGTKGSLISLVEIWGLLVADRAFAGPGHLLREIWGLQFKVYNASGVLDRKTW